VPLRIAIGPRDLEKRTVEIARRDTLSKEIVSKENVVDRVRELLGEMQKSLFSKALNYQQEHITLVDDYDTFKEVLKDKGGFISAFWDGTSETEESIKKETKATIRCIPLDAKEEEGVCVYSGKPATKRVLFAKAY
jgi:prolyl-tRNA synthetase